MTTALQHRRGTTSEHSTFTGLEGEITIDTTKDTAVVHDGATAGGIPLARENLSNVSTSGLASIDGASTASDDKFFVYDQSTTTLKTITRAELNNAMEQDALASVSITGGTINGTSVGATTASSGAFTTLSASSTVSGSGFSTYLASPPAIGGTAAAAGSFTTLSASGVATFSAGSASAPALTTSGDTNTGIAFPAADTVGIATGGTERVRVDSAGNVGIGVTPSAWDSNSRAIQLRNAGGLYDLNFGGASTYTFLSNNSYRASGGTDKYLNTYAASYYVQNNGVHSWGTAPSGTAGDPISFTQAMTLDQSGNLSVGYTSAASRLDVTGTDNTGTTLASRVYSANRTAFLGFGFSTISASSNSSGLFLEALGANVMTFSTNGSERARIDSSGSWLVGTTSATDSSYRAEFKNTGGLIAVSTDTTSNVAAMSAWQQHTSGNNKFVLFYTEASPTIRGSITYNRAGGLTAYNTTSDYRAKTVNGPVQNALSKLAALKPSTGRMNGAEYDIDFFVAHELQEVVPSAVVGEKDAVKEDGTPDYQMVDKSALIPLLTAALQEQQAIITTLTERITALEQA